MKVVSVINIQARGPCVCGESPWEEGLEHKMGDVLSCGEKQWRVRGLSLIHQSCFGAPKTKYHNLLLEPIGHDEQPNVGDELVKQ
jgi:hypothetical protein